MNIEDKIKEILDVKGTIQFLEDKNLVPFTVRLVHAAEVNSIKSIVVDSSGLADYSLHSLLNIFLERHKNKSSPLVDRAIWITKNNDVFKSLTPNEVAGIFDEILFSRKQHSLAIVLLPNKIIKINEQLLAFIDEIISLPLRTETQWCFMSSSRELMVLLGLLLPEDYASNKVVVEKHIYQGKYKRIKPKQGGARNALIAQFLEGTREITSTTPKLKSWKDTDPVMPESEVEDSRQIKPITVQPEKFDDCTIDIHRGDKLIMQSITLKPRQWVRVTNSDKSTWKGKPFDKLIDFIIYRTDADSYLLINPLKNHGITLISKDVIRKTVQNEDSPSFKSSTITRKTVLKAKVHNQGSLFLETLLPSQCELEIQVSNQKLFIELSRF